jgi:transportin-1
VKDFAICGLDVLSGLCEGLGQHFKSLVQETKSEDAVLSLLFMCLRDPLPEVRQSGFSLAGEVCKSAPGVLPENAQQELLTVAISNLDVDFPLVSNNASWTIGEIAVMSGGAAMAPYLGRIMTPIIQMLSNRNQLPLNLKQNLAITIGRLGVTNTQQMAEILPEILVDFCACLKVTPQSEERDHAFRGLIAILHANPGILGGSANAVPALYMACASWDDPPVSKHVYMVAK